MRSNPVDKLAVENGLTAQGRRQADAVADFLASSGVESPIIWYSNVSSHTQFIIAFYI